MRTCFFRSSESLKTAQTLVLLRWASIRSAQSKRNLKCSNRERISSGSASAPAAAPQREREKRQEEENKLLCRLANTDRQKERKRDGRDLSSVQHRPREGEFRCEVQKKTGRPNPAKGAQPAPKETSENTQTGPTGEARHSRRAWRPGSAHELLSARQCPTRLARSEPAAICTTCGWSQSPPERRGRESHSASESASITLPRAGLAFFKFLFCKYVF